MLHGGVICPTVTVNPQPEIKTWPAFRDDMPQHSTMEDDYPVRYGTPVYDATRRMAPVYMHVLRVCASSTAGMRHAS